MLKGVALLKGDNALHAGQLLRKFKSRQYHYPVLGKLNARQTASVWVFAADKDSLKIFINAITGVTACQG